ncbi:OmpH family outer membrane protein [Sphingobacterium wenxiniae]|uniref:Periplasmic chaperone for outer membrane proteins Skp n=1 Tax=Sphingobacterium wenxiniae TaxID=683125 RepID=A0A1I6P7A4_9SPHI|nr:OmpH family outer membrane protein [Sphingobacterium wenxiniae]SFS36067.1 periplasmic chaperone for outer membrane proteins Skp [Sphingobacterium wenxiniae]
MKNLFKGAALAAVMFLGTQYVSAQQKVGHINADEVFQATPEFKAAEEQLKTLQESKGKEYQGMVEEYQKKLAEAQEKARTRSEANKATVDVELEAMGQELQNIEQRIQENQRIAQEEVGKKQQDLLAPIQQKVMNAINAVAKEKGYAYILDVSNGSVIYFDGGEDVSADVKAKLGIK